MKNTISTLYINAERVSVYTAPAKCRAALARYTDAPQFRSVCECYRNPSYEKQRAENGILERIRRNSGNAVNGCYTVLSFNNFNFTTGYFLDAVDPETGEDRIILCTETARYQYHYDVTDLL